MKHAPHLIALLALTACGGQGPAENTADQLEAAADQSTDPAADVLENAADRIDEGNVQSPKAAAQQALENAGEADMGGSPPGVSQPVDDPGNGY